ncbi:zf-DHHC-domain-containing protein [Phlebopus sp. FC_14]|nr:zf-DHHC-domain-containing protein [Phlebopus sp. FC_14]
MATITAFMGLLLALYVYLCMDVRSPKWLVRPARDTLTEPYECADLLGSLTLCYKDHCFQSWKPPRAHHCTTCGVCRLNYDHHCPWLGNCVTLDIMKEFLLFLYLCPLAFVVGAAPVARILLRHAASAYRSSRADGWAQALWWDWPGSWFLFAGPLGRPIFGTLLGYSILQANQDLSWLSGQTIQQPCLHIALVAGLAFLMSIFTLGLAIMTTRNILRGQTAVETLRSSSRRNILLLVPCEISRGTPTPDADDAMYGRVHRLRHDTRLYDLGWRRNWRAVVQKPLFARRVANESTFSWPKLNPAVLRHVREYCG